MLDVEKGCVEERVWRGGRRWLYRAEKCTGTGSAGQGTVTALATALSWQDTSETDGARAQLQAPHTDGEGTREARAQTGPTGANTARPLREVPEHRAGQGAPCTKFRCQRAHGARTRRPHRRAARCPLGGRCGDPTQRTSPVPTGRLAQGGHRADAGGTSRWQGCPASASRTPVAPVTLRDRGPRGERRPDGK